MPSLPIGGIVLPSVITNITTQSPGVSVPIGTRVMSIIGLGTRTEIIVASALGGGQDGFNPTYTSVSGADGRHFELSNAPTVINRTQLFKNGILLQGTEGQITSTTTFSDAFDYIIDPATGHILLQSAHLIDLGGSFYTTGASNVGQGSLQNLTLLDIDAPQETWTIKCISVQRNNLNQPIAGTALFVAFGSVSGNVLDANGNTITWLANNTVNSNGILSFSILETSPPFRPGDSFTVKTYSGVLAANDSLTAAYIAVADINNPTFFSSMAALTTMCGQVSTANTLSLGAFLAFQNSTPGVLACEAAPSLPRRISYELETNFPATSTNVEDFVIPLPLGITPDPNSSIHFFVTNPVTSIETQLLPNMFPFDTLGTSGNPTVSTFVFDNANPPAGNSFSYSVIQENATLNFGQDGYINRALSTQINAVFSVPGIIFTEDYLGTELNVINATNAANIGLFSVIGVANGDLQIRAASTPPFPDFINETSAGFQLVNSVTGEMVPASDGSDGTLVAIADTATGTLHSTAINFASFQPVPNGYKLQITSSVHGNVGLYDITSYNSGTNTLTIAKSFVSENNVTFEVIDTTQTSSYLVVNHNVVPNNYSLRVTIVDVLDAPFFDAGWVNALASLQTQELDILVPLPTQTISAIFENSLQHCITMSNLVNKKERILFIGAINGLTPANLIGTSPAAVEDLGVLEGIQGNTISEVLAGDTEDLANYSVPDAYGFTFRCVYFFPDQIVVNVGGQNTIVSGYYIAAAGAAFFAATPNIALPITNKTISGFTILNNRIFPIQTEAALAGAGVTVVEPVQGGGNVIWGITTTQSGSPVEQEITAIFIRDRIAKSLRAGLKGYIGQPQDNDIIATILARTTALLNGFASQGIITAYTNLTVKQDPVDPRQVDVVVLVTITEPVNWIYVQVGID